MIQPSSWPHCPTFRGFLLGNNFTFRISRYGGARCSVSRTMSRGRLKTPVAQVLGWEGWLFIFSKGYYVYAAWRFHLVGGYSLLSPPRRGQVSLEVGLPWLPSPTWLGGIHVLPSRPLFFLPSSLETFCQHSFTLGYSHLLTHKPSIFLHSGHCLLSQRKALASPPGPEELRTGWLLLKIISTFSFTRISDSTHCDQFCYICFSIKFLTNLILSEKLKSSRETSHAFSHNSPKTKDHSAATQKVSPLFPGGRCLCV